MNPNHKYVMFAGWHYYPNGGWSDAKKTSDSLQELLEWAETFDDYESRDDFDWWHIVDLTTLKEVADNYSGVLDERD